MWLNDNIDIRNRYLLTVQNIIFDDNNINDDLEWYGYDPSAPIPEDIDLPHVIVDDFDVNQDIIHVLQTIDPLQPSNSMGIDMYLDCVSQINGLDIFKNIYTCNCIPFTCHRNLIKLK